MEEFNERLFGDIGAKIKLVAKIFFWIETIAGVISALICMVNARDIDDELFIIGLGVLVAAPLVAWLSSICLYGFGELVETTATMNSHIYALRKQVCGEPQAYAPQPSTYAQQPQQTQYVPRPQPTYTPPATTPTRTTANGGWKCKKCGTENTSSTTFCKNCGEYK